MAVPTTWTELKAALVTLSVRDDLEDLVGDFIGYAENWFQREIFSPEREATVTLTVTNGTAPLPADFGGVKSLYLDSTRDSDLEFVAPARLRALYPTTEAGTPCHYAIDGETVLIGPYPSPGSVIKLAYIEGITPLGASNATNWLLTAHPDLYVNASLAELHNYLRDYTEADRRRAMAAGAGESILRSARRRKGNSGPLRAAVPIPQFRHTKA